MLSGGSCQVGFVKVFQDQILIFAEVGETFVRWAKHVEEAVDAGCTKGICEEESGGGLVPVLGETEVTPCELLHRLVLN